MKNYIKKMWPTFVTIPICIAVSRCAPVDVALVVTYLLGGFSCGYYTIISVQQENS